MKNKTDTKKRVFLRTFGCQMNTYDSQFAVGMLEQAGFEVIAEPESTADAKGKVSLSRGADIVIMNTCSVREHAEDRVYSRLGMLRKDKEKNPALIIGLMGCMVEEHREKLFKRCPYLDLMIGTRNIKELPGMIREIQEKRKLAALRKKDKKLTAARASKIDGLIGTRGPLAYPQAGFLRRRCGRCCWRTQSPEGILRSDSLCDFRIVLEFAAGPTRDCAVHRRARSEEHGEGFQEDL